MPSSHHPSSSTPREKTPSKSKSKKAEDWTHITDSEQRRRVQNKLAQRKFREKAKEKKEREERDANDRMRSYQAYETHNPQVLEEDSTPSGLPWGGISFKPVYSRSYTKGSESKSLSQEAQSPYQHSPAQYSPSKTIYEDPDQEGVFEHSEFYDDGERPCYDHQSESGSYGY